MIGKITTALGVALLLGSVGVASAQTRMHAPANGVLQAPFADYYNQDYWRGFGSTFSPAGLDPYAGTIWEGVAPY